MHTLTQTYRESSVLSFRLSDDGLLEIDFHFRESDAYGLVDMVKKALNDDMDFDDMESEVVIMQMMQAMKKVQTMKLLSQHEVRV